jgi:hypothetical protein
VPKSYNLHEFHLLGPLPSSGLERREFLRIDILRNCTEWPFRTR